MIGVLGGAQDKRTLKGAEQTGRQIGLNRAILLTGEDNPYAGDLKALLLAGGLTARESGVKVPWIGVVRELRHKPPDDLSLVLAPEVKNRRNCIEADICHAAIAFEGGDGTSSEVVLCLALGQPLVLVGDYWLSKYPVVSGPAPETSLASIHRVNSGNRFGVPGQGR